MNIKLIAKTHKGKNIISRWGDRWKLFARLPNRVGVISSKDIESSHLPDSFRWIEEKGDRDFNIQIVEE